MDAGPENRSDAAGGQAEANLPSPAHGRGARGEGSSPRPAHPEVSKGELGDDVTVATLTAIEAEGALYPLTRLLEGAVESGASIGFLLPMAKAEALAYWKSVLPALRDGSKLLLAAKRGGVIVGSAQLNLEPRANGRHRAEVSKLMVHTSARRRGIGRALMLAAEEEARRLGRTTLVLDTREGDPSQALYRSLGWQLAGVIPNYARSSNGNVDAVAFYYKLLAPTPTRP